MEPLTILAAAGSLPVHVAAAAAAAGRPVFVIGLEGTADERLRSFPHEMVKWGQLGRALDLIAAHKTRDIVVAGLLDARPDFRGIRVDFGAFAVLPRILALLAGGDDTVLSGLVRLLEDLGYRVVGAHEIAPDLVAEPGLVVGLRLPATALADAKLAFGAARAIGLLDAGQAAIVVDTRVVALEGAEGTDAMVARVAELRRSGRVRWLGRRGVLAKCAKPQQDVRMDMPVIGAVTVRNVADAGLAGIVVEAGRVMIVERVETIAAAEQTGTFILAESGAAGR
ncbi:MAG: UDP-2,3-diacylglucosamine diphosphatase LpxI [Bauldia sp.]